jgi:hypothetical protein
VQRCFRPHYDPLLLQVCIDLSVGEDDFVAIPIVVTLDETLQVFRSALQVGRNNRAFVPRLGLLFAYHGLLNLMQWSIRVVVVCLGFSLHTPIYFLSDIDVVVCASYDVEVVLGGRTFF